MMELEKKLLLAKEEYDRLLEYFGQDVRPTKQINYYFDTDDYLMNRHDITCRIRWKNGEYQATLKQHIRGTNQSKEVDLKVRGIGENSFVDAGLRLQGSLTTRRFVIMKNNFCEVVLDKNDYLRYVDYELEIEYSDGHEQETEQILDLFREVLSFYHRSLATDEMAERMRNTMSKSQRFFQKKKLISTTGVRNEA